jgi:hypothetical protein
MAIQGLRTSENFVANARPQNWREGVLKLYPNGDAPLFALTNLMKSRTVDDPQFNWWEKAMETHRFALGANLSGTGGIEAVTLAAASVGTSVKEGDILLVEHTGELLYVIADPTSDLGLTVQRGFAGTSVTAVTYNGASVNPNIRVVGSAYEEGSLAPTGVEYDPTQKYNYTQIFRDTLEATRTAIKTRLRTGNELQTAKAECLEVHSRNIELSMFFGQRYATTKNSRPLRTMGGIKSFIPSANQKTASTHTLAEFEEFLMLMFQYGSDEKMAFLGNRALLSLNQMVRKNTHWQIISGIKEFGMNVTRFICPFGELVMKRHKLFNQSPGGTNAGSSTYYGLDSAMFVLDMANLTYVNLTDSDTKYQKDLQVPGQDGTKAGYLSEISMEIHHPYTHFFVNGLTSGAADS